jgi:serine protease Do
MKNIRTVLFTAVPTLLLFFLLSLFDNVIEPAGHGSLLAAAGNSPLRGGDQVAAALKVQDTFRKVFDINQHRVVYISTEQTVKLPPNPLFDDPMFREFFGAPRSGMPKTQKRTGLGTGFILSEDGYICTNYHLVAGVDKVKVKVDKILYDAAIVGTDERTDIALLKISPKEKLAAVYLGDSNTVRVGDWAIAIGNPFGLDRTFTVGVISAVGRKDLDFMGGSQTHIQTDASINPGNSGGPLLNVYGEVIGINRMIYSQSGGNIGIGFAIPINTAKTILEELKIHKKIKRGYIGVQVVPLTEEYAKELGLRDNEAALVGQVLEGSPAAKGGVQVGDVILSADGKKIKDIGDLISTVERTAIGSSLKIEVWRKKEIVNLFLTIAERK